MTENYDGIPVKVKKTLHAPNVVHISPLQGQKTFCSIRHGKTKQRIIDDFDGVEVCTICRHKIDEWPEFIRVAFKQQPVHAT